MDAPMIHVLLIDDDEDDALLTRELLEDAEGLPVYPGLGAHG
jgi:CheY-like chemotaxis protein